MSSVSLEQLSKKNQEFIRIATHQFIKDGKSDQEIKDLLEDILPTILENQPKGITARSLYGAPTIWAASLSEKEHQQTENPQENTNPYLMFADASLFIFGFFATINSIVNLFSTNSSQYGILTLILGSIAGGCVFYAMYHFIYRFYYPEEDMQKKPHIVKSFLVIAAATLLWATVLYGTALLLPAAINPQLPSIATLIIGAATLGLRFYLRKKLNIRSALTTPKRF